MTTSHIHLTSSHSDLDNHLALNTKGIKKIPENMDEKVDHLVYDFSVRFLFLTRAQHTKSCETSASAALAWGRDPSVHGATTGAELRKHPTAASATAAMGGKTQKPTRCAGGTQKPSRCTGGTQKPTCASGQVLQSQVLTHPHAPLCTHSPAHPRTPATHIASW